MEKHFLATISNDTDNLCGVRFIGSFFNAMSANRVTLFHICKSDSVTKSQTSIWDNPSDIAASMVPNEAKKSIQKAQKILAECNMPVEHVITKTIAEKYGKVQDILAESARGHYDAIVLGRRASYTLQWMFDRPTDETFQAMIRQHTCVSPLWICPDIEAGRKNVLVCIDGSENGYRAVDHVGFILASQKQHAITLLYVESSVSTDCVEYFRRADEILQNHAIDEKRIHHKVIWGLSVSSTILAEVKKRKHAVVALGMSGQKTGKGGGRVAGTTTAKLISKLEKTSLWCCP